MQPIQVKLCVWLLQRMPSMHTGRILGLCSYISQLWVLNQLLLQLLLQPPLHLGVGHPQMDGKAALGIAGS